jgi:hypothetical protein
MGVVYVGESEIDDAALQALAVGSPSLVGLNLRGCKKVSDAGLIPVLLSCQLLGTVNLEGCDGVTDAAVDALLCAMARRNVMSVRVVGTSLSALAVERIENARRKPTRPLE